MKRFFILALCAVLSVSPVLAGSMTLLGAGKPAAGGAYSGPGDVVSAAKAWWGLRAYNAAVAGTKAVNVCNVSDVACADMLTDASTGALVITTIGGSNCGVVVCTVKTIYDQSGNTNCAAAACDLTQATIANRPTLVLNCIGSLPCMNFASSGPQSLLSTNGLTQAQPFTVSLAAFQTTAVSGGIVGAVSSYAVYFLSSTMIEMFFGGTIDVATSLSTWYAVQAIANAASSTAYINGTATNGNAGTNANGNALKMGGDAGANNLNGKIVEAGIWGGGFNGTQQSNMNSNQRTYWGF